MAKLFRLFLVFVSFSLLARFVLYPFSSLPDLSTGIFCALGDELLNLVFVHKITANLATSAPLFDGGFFFPYADTLTFSENLLLPAFIYRAWWWVTNQSILSYHFMLFTVLGANATAAFWMARRYFSCEAAWIGGFIYAFSLVRLAQMSHIQLFPAWWYPLALVAAFEFYKTPTRRRSLALAVILVGQFYSGIYLGFMLLCALLPVFAVVLRQEKDKRTLLINLVCFGAVFGILVGPMAYPYFAMSKVHGIVRDIDEARQYSAYVWSYLTPAPESLYSWWSGVMHFGKNLHEKRLFVGVITLLLCAYAYRRRAEVPEAARKLFFLGLAITLWLSLGPNAVLYAILYFVLPGFKALRCPARFSMVYLVFVALAAAFAVDRLPKRQAMVAALLALLVIDNHTFIPLVKMPTYLEGATRYLAAHPDKKAAIHLPLRGEYGRFPGDQGNQEANREVVRMYYSLFHGHPIANGYSGFAPKIFNELAAAEGIFGPSAQLADALRARQIQYVVIEKAMLQAGQRDAWLKWAQSHPALFESDEVYLFALSPEKT